MRALTTRWPRAGALLLAAACFVTASAAVPVETLGGPLVDREIVSPVSVLSAEELEKLPAPRDIAQLALLQPGEPVTVPGTYKGISLRPVPPPAPAGPGPEEVEAITLSLGTGTLANGSDVTRFIVPKTLRAGPVVLDFAPANGNPFSQQSHVYGFLRAWIEQDKLRSFQRAGFGYDIDFGRGPGQVALVVTTMGPINYRKAGHVQTVAIDGSGKASFADYITALKGSPVGTPFTVLPHFSRLQLRK